MFMAYVILILVVIVCFATGVGMLRDPQKTLEKSKDLKNKTQVIIGGIVFVLISVVTLVVGIFLLNQYLAIDKPPSQSNNSTVNEEQMNDLGYYKENGKWNYEGGDAGQNDGVSGD